MKLLVLLIPLFSAFASEQIERFFIIDKQVQFKKIDGLLVSKDCWTKNCDVFKINPHQLNFYHVEQHLNGGTSPGVVLCKHKLKNEISVGYQYKTQKQRVFCTMNDGSYITQGSLQFLKQRTGKPPRIKANKGIN